ncbi:hypothetical protein [Myxococcus landrumensis]|uniref:Dickkopf N-terminal cysteine-rich domain-containing protein n=1 Tax=Myxococcus landrumensis TaxID=2813577 RepID=A0ABX7MXR6_9BACT|nr:hypothetical protein [Myxococcus landrumus]QSQ10989.1 hypothetical protein JY572_21445 [Myxococcus landrumus]
MNWRTPTTVITALLLPLPLVLILGGALQPQTPESIRGRAISPVLSVEERSHLRTYRRNCSTSDSCEAPLGCLMDARAHAQYCADSQCLTDAQCSDGQHCQLLSTEGSGPLVRYCIPRGIRAEGERCIKVPATHDEACAPGLVCGGRGGFCARPCTLSSSKACAPGFFCADTRPEPLCLPSCEQRGCPEGQQCIRHDEGASTCARVLGPSCQQSPCPQGQTCEVIHSPQFPDRIWSECEQRCGQDRPPCPSDLVCDGWSCKQPCQPNGPNTCAEGFRCFQRRPSSPWVCHPHW